VLIIRCAIVVVIVDVIVAIGAIVVRLAIDY